MTILDHCGVSTYPDVPVLGVHICVVGAIRRVYCMQGLSFLRVLSGIDCVPMVL